MNEVILRDRQFRIIADLYLGRLQKALPPAALIAEFQPHDAEQTEFMQYRERVAHFTVGVTRRRIPEIGDIGLGDFLELVKRQHICFYPPEQQLSIRYSKERAHFSEYRVDDRLCRRIYRTSDGLGRAPTWVDFDDLATDEH